MSVETCESCGMPMATAEDHSPDHPDSRWCRYCAPDGTLEPFEERFERLVQWSIRKDGLNRPAAEEATREYMRGMPAWRHHPALAEGVDR
jgi:Putative zinc ribbon domain